MKLKGMSRALRALAALTCVAVMFMGNFPFMSQTVSAQGPNFLVATKIPANDGEMVTVTGNNKVGDPGDIFFQDDGQENFFVFVVDNPTILSFSVTYVNAQNSDIDIYLAKLLDNQAPVDASDTDVNASSALGGNPEVVGPLDLGVPIFFTKGRYLFTLSVFDDPTVQATAWTLTIKRGGTTLVLSGNSGLPNSGVNAGTGTVIQVNCVTPTRFPFKLTAVRLVHFRFQNQPSPTGRQLTLVYFTGPAPMGDTAPVVPRLTVDATNSTVATIKGTGAWNSYPVTNGPTVQPGQVLYVGYLYSGMATGIFPTLDRGRNKRNLSFLSGNNGMTFTPLMLSSGDPADLTDEGEGTFGTAPARVVVPSRKADLSLEDIVKN